jgi:MerR family transcriptional regulator, light-induced transcriptional regulator
MLYSERMHGETRLRIGELSRRSGVSPELLRAWERRYGLLEPTRSSGGLRLYSLGDLERVQSMRQHVARGIAPAEAAALVRRPTPAPGPARPSADAARAELAEALGGYDEPQAQAVVDRLLSTWTLDALLADVVLPYLDDVGERWHRGELSVAQEHFASTVLRGRLLGLARDWGRGIGPLALLACLPGEQHEFGLIACGLALRARGWRVAYLGSDTPLETVESAAHALEPAVVVLSASTGDRVDEIAHELKAFARRHRVGLGGKGAETAPQDLGVVLLPNGPVQAADELTSLQYKEERR